MSLLKRFDDDLKEALKASEAERVSILRLVRSAFKNKQIDKGRELSEEEIISVLSTMIKQGRESIEQFTRANRMDLAQKEEREVAFLQSYMPQQLSHEEIDGIISEAIKEAAAIGAQEMGKVMRIVMPKLKGVADGKYVNQRVKELLEKP
ncbi:MAG TPA: GatB/YqeY domain-containing protein [Thermodesulfovibrionales bacterium]|nr:GatB/YqeY domain-containing protein [Thermodesulfovibrionales bacterium]